LLINSEDSHLIKCTPRGVDAIDYSNSKPTTSNDMEILIFMLAIFIMFDMLPFIGSVLQSLVVIASAPRLIKIGLSLISNQRNKENMVNIAGGIKMTQDSALSIEQQ
jgi:hypothetical protein